MDNVFVAEVVRCRSCCRLPGLSHPDNVTSYSSPTWLQQIKQFHCHLHTPPCPCCQRHDRNGDNPTIRQRRPTTRRRGDGSGDGPRQVRILQRGCADTGAGRVSDGGLWRGATVAQLSGAHRAPSRPAGDSTVNTNDINSVLWESGGGGGGDGSYGTEEPTVL